MSPPPPPGDAVPDKTRGDAAFVTWSAPRRRRWRGRIVALVVLLLLAVGVAMAVLARPLLTARHEATQAQADLVAAKAALTAKDLPTARADIAGARAYVDSADQNANGFGADMWSAVPVAGGAVDDARHLIDALSETTSVAEMGVKVYPMVSGNGSQLVRGQRIDLHVLLKVVAETTAIGDHLDRALADVNQVKGTTPFVGDSATRAKDTALHYLLPVKQSYDRAGPLVKSLPTIVGAHGPKTYLLAMLNPAELRYSGGGTLSFTTMHFDHGKATFSPSVNVDDINSHGIFQRWKAVPGNVFHRPAPMRVTSATFSPWWSVSGEELLRAYQKVYPGQHLDGAIGLDLQSLAQVFKVTGPVDLPHFGTITADNLVQTLAGSYGDFASTQVRHQLNAELVPAFQQKFFEGGKMTDKLKALVDSADGRHFFTYFRDPREEHRFARVGLSGDLSRTRHDYIGVFSQNENGSKVDYWQHRAVSSQVHLNPDGSASVHLRVNVVNGSPPYTLPVPDPKTGYTTRYLGTALGVFMPYQVKLGAVKVNGAPYHPKVRFPRVSGVHNRRYFADSMMLDSGQNTTIDVSYKVPDAAEVTSSTAMTYMLDVDPQDLVVPETLQVSLTWPAGWVLPSALPAGWEATSTTSATYVGSVATKLAFQIPLVKR